MAVKQLAVFVENHQGTLAEITDLLAASGIDIRALSISETQDFGILRMIVDDLDTAVAALKQNKSVYSVNDVVGVAVPDESGSIAKVIRLLSDNMINIEYVYAFVGDSGRFAWVVLRVADNERAESCLSSAGYRILSDADIKSI